MYAQWVASSAELPHDGQSVEFLLDGRDVAMDGTYVGQAFRSHWFDYDVGRVRNWRLAGDTSVRRACLSLGDHS